MPNGGTRAASKGARGVSAGRAAATAAIEAMMNVICIMSSGVVVYCKDD